MRWRDKAELRRLRYGLGLSSWRISPRKHLHWDPPCAQILLCWGKTYSTRCGIWTWNRSKHVLLHERTKFTDKRIGGGLQVDKNHCIYSLNIDYIDYMLVHISICCRLVQRMFLFARTITSSMMRSQMLGATVVCDLWVWSLTSVAWRSLVWTSGHLASTKAKLRKASQRFYVSCQVGFTDDMFTPIRSSWFDRFDQVGISWIVLFFLYGWWFQATVALVRTGGPRPHGRCVRSLETYFA